MAPKFMNGLLELRETSNFQRLEEKSLLFVLNSGTSYRIVLFQKREYINFEMKKYQKDIGS